MAGKGYTTHGGEDSDMNVISSHIHHFDSEENVWRRFKGNTLKDSWDQKKNKNKMKKIKIKCSQKKSWETKIWVATSALLLFWQVCPQELPQWQNTEWHVSCWQFCQHRILRYRSVKNNKVYIQQVKTGKGGVNQNHYTACYKTGRKRKKVKNKFQ